MVDLAHGPTLAAHAVWDGARLAGGATAGDYVVERFIGAGAMGEVYAGLHPVIGKRVAIKVLRRELASSEEAARRFVREAQAVNQIDHPNVVNIFAFGRLADGRLYLVMDLVEGRSLREVVAAGPTEPTEALEILGAIAEALDAAHARGVVHRDLKPDNIVMSSRAKLFVLDFGLAKLVSTANAGSAGPGTLTGQGTWLGTPGYMAPEQWSADGAGTASDRYALGVIAFELLCGTLPFSAASVPAMMEQHFRAEIPPLSTRGVALPVGIDAVLKRAMAKDPAARFPTGQAMVEALRSAAGTGVGARPTIAAPDPKRAMVVPALAGAGVLGFAIVAFLMVRGGADRPRSETTADEEASAADRNSPGGQPAGTRRIDVISTPPGAEVRQGVRVIGATPMPLYVKPGASMAIIVTKPGYLPEERTVSAKADGSVEPFSLLAITRFEGVWRLPNGELRAFERRGEQIDVSKLDDVDGPKQFYRHYGLVTADQGVAFASEEEVVDPRAPDDSGCHLRVRVEYRYTPSDDVLELRRERVKIDLVEHHCVVRSRTVDADRLVRVDAGHDPADISAPAGAPSQAGQRARKPGKVLPIDPKAAVQQKLDAKASSNAFDTVGKRPTSPYTTTKNRPVDNIYQGDSQQAQNPPQPQPQTQVAPQHQATTPPQPQIQKL